MCCRCFGLKAQILKLECVLCVQMDGGAGRYAWGKPQPPKPTLLEQDRETPMWPPKPKALGLRPWWEHPAAPVWSNQSLVM